MPYFTTVHFKNMKLCLQPALRALTFAMLTLASTATRPMARDCLNMADERSRPPYNPPSPIPAAYAWPALLARDGDALFDHDRHTLEVPGKQPGTLALHMSGA